MLFKQALVLGRYFQNYYLCGMNPIVLTVLGLLFGGNDSHAKRVAGREGYCKTSVNAAVFRGASLISNDSVQYIHIMIRKVT